MPPEPRLIRTPRDAEEVACDWLRHWGHGDAVVTPVGADGGIDVYASDVVAQVKAEAKPTGRPVMQALGGVANAEGKAGVFFSLGGYTPEAIAWANRADIALFTFDLTGTPEALNRVAEEIISAEVEEGAGRLNFASRPMAEPLPGPWAQPLPKQDLHCEPLRPGERADPKRLAVTLKALSLPGEMLAGRSDLLWTRSHRYLWSASAWWSGGESVSGDVEVFHLCLPQWRHGRIPQPRPAHMTDYEASAVVEEVGLDWMSPADAAEEAFRQEWDAEGTASQLALKLYYNAGPWESVLVQMVADLHSVLSTLGVSLEQTNLEVRDFSAEVQLGEQRDLEDGVAAAKAGLSAAMPTPDLGDDYASTIALHDPHHDQEVRLVGVTSRRGRTEVAKILSEELGLSRADARRLVNSAPVSLGVQNLDVATRINARVAFARGEVELRSVNY